MVLCAIRKGVDAGVGRVFVDAIKLLHPGRELFDPVYANRCQAHCISFLLVLAQGPRGLAASDSFHCRSGFRPDFCT